MRRVFCSLLLIMLLSIAVPASAQNDASDARPILYGQTISGSISDATPAELFYFDGLVGEEISISLTADDASFDPRVFVYTEEGFENGDLAIVEDDDGGDGLNSLIESFTLPESTLYIIEATRFSGEGSYSLTLELLGQSASASSASEIRQWANFATATSQYGDDGWSASQATGEPNTFDCGDITSAWASATSTGSDVLALEFETPVRASEVNIHQTYNPGSIVMVELSNTQTSETLEIPNSADPVGNTPCPGVFSLDVSGLEFIADGVIIYLDQTIGGSWNEIDAVELVGTDPTLDLTELVYGDFVIGTISDATPQQVYQFTGETGDVVSISMDADDTSALDPYLELYTASGYATDSTAIAFNDDSGGLNSRIDAFTLPEDGEYIIVATRFSGEDDFLLSLELDGMTEATMPTDGDGGQTIVLDEGTSDISMTVPANWQTAFDGGINIFGSSSGAMDVFGDTVVPAPEGEIAIAVFSPTTLAEIASNVEAQTSEAYLETALLGFGFEGDIRPYTNFAVPASFAPLIPSADAPENAVMFVLELEEGFALVVVVTGGNPQEFEAEVIPLVNSLAGIEPSFGASDMDMEGGNALDADLTTLETREFRSDDGSELITVSVPPSWITDSEFGAVDIANSQTAIESGIGGVEMPEGEFYMSILFPGSAAEQFSIAGDSTPTQALETFNTLVDSSGTIEEITIFDVPAMFSTVDIADFVGEAIVIALGFDEGTVLVLVQPGGSVDEYEPIITALVESISYDTE